MTIDNSWWVVEILHTNDPLWPGNQLYANETVAKFWAIHDYEEYYMEPGADMDVEWTWIPIGRGVFHLYEDGLGTDVELRYRPVKGK